MLRYRKLYFSTLQEPLNGPLFLTFLFFVSYSFLAFSCSVVANHLFIVDPIPSPAQVAQLTARVVRMGQAKPCYIYHMVVANTIEERLLELRTRLAGGEEAQRGTASSASADNLSPKDMLWLLEQE